jgi:hypothetical protein
VEAASIEELHQKIQTLEIENNKEEEYRNYMQLERVSSSMAVLPQHAITLLQRVADRTAADCTCVCLASRKR